MQRIFWTIRNTPIEAAWSHSLVMSSKDDVNTDKNNSFSKLLLQSSDWIVETWPVKIFYELHSFYTTRSSKYNSAAELCFP